MGRANIDIEQAEGFLRSLSKSCDDYCLCQRDIGRAYSLVQEGWKDKVTSYTGLRLTELSNHIGRFYRSLTDTFFRTETLLSGLRDYDNLPQVSLSNPPVYYPSIQERRDMNNAVIVTNVASLEQFRDALKTYISSLVNITNALSSRYNSLSSSWNDAQYEQFGRDLNAFKRNLNNEIDILVQIVGYLNTKIEKLNNTLKGYQR